MHIPYLGSVLKCIENNLLFILVLFGVIIVLLDLAKTIEKKKPIVT